MGQVELTQFGLIQNHIPIGQMGQVTWHIFFRMFVESREKEREKEKERERQPLWNKVVHISLVTKIFILYLKNKFLDRIDLTHYGKWWLLYH